MTSEIQYKHFQLMYHEQQDRAAELVNRGKIFLPILTAYLGFLVFKGETYLEAENNVIVILFYLSSAITFISALILVIRALSIYRYEVPTLPLDLIRKASDIEQSDEEFREDRVIDYAVATDRNFTQNEKRATHLNRASWLLLAGVLFHLLAFTAKSTFYFMG